MKMAEDSESARRLGIDVSGEEGAQGLVRGR